MPYRCKHCKNTRVQGTLPAWFEVNGDLSKVEDVDVEADFEYGHCPDCDVSGNFNDVVERIA